MLRDVCRMLCVVCCLLRVGHWASFVARCLLLVGGLWLFVGRWLSVARCSLLAVCCLLFEVWG